MGEIVLWVIGALIIWCAWHMWRGSRIEARVQEHLANRQPLTDDEFYCLFFKDKEVPQEVVTKVMRIVKKVTGVDISRARPDDRLVEDLGISAWDGLEFTEIVIRLEKEFNLRVPDQEWEKVVTLGDLILLVAQKR